jgi:hypothetical protein
MLRRCYCKSAPEFPRYGGAGVRVYEPWRKDFNAFFEYMGLKPSQLHSIDRYPNSKGNYEPGNVRWANPLQQTDNRGITRKVVIDGVTKTCGQLSRELQVDIHDIYATFGFPGSKAIRKTVIPVAAVEAVR